VFVRVGEADNKLYLDLCDKAWRAVEIDGDGWRVIDKPPVRFRRSSGMTPLPEPERGGSITDLRKFLNVKSDADFVMVVSWLLAAFRNRGPYPVLVLTGEQGSAKSTLSAILRSLIDPNVAPLRSLPREIRDLFIAANNGHALVFDNLSSLPDWLSDALCRLATGGAFAVRQNYTDQDEVLFDAVRPIILNGIEDVATKGDLVERSIVSMLTPIDESKRKTEAELWASFEAARPRLLGALLNAVSRGIKRLPQTTMEKLPRMADFALWATACETEFCPPGTTFNSAYSSNRDNAVEIAIEASPLAAAIRSLMAGRTGTEWTGTSTQLLADLASVAGEGATKSRAWPKVPNALSSKLRRAAPDLRKVGHRDRLGSRKYVPHHHYHHRPAGFSEERGNIVTIGTNTGFRTKFESEQWLSW
jgi:hypothetical protein